MDTDKVWFVTGASKGMGLSLVKRLIRSGYRVAATRSLIYAAQLIILLFASILLQYLS